MLYPPKRHWFKAASYTGINTTMVEMRSAAQRRELGDFIRAQRERLDPAAIGLADAWPAADAGAAAGGDRPALRSQHHLVHLDRARARCLGVAVGAGPDGNDVAPGPGRARLPVRPGGKTRPGAGRRTTPAMSRQPCWPASRRSACRPMCWIAVGRRDAGMRRRSICSPAGWISRTNETCCASCFSERRACADRRLVVRARRVVAEFRASNSAHVTDPALRAFIQSMRRESPNLQNSGTGTACLTGRAASGFSTIRGTVCCALFRSPSISRAGRT